MKNVAKFLKIIVAASFAVGSFSTALQAQIIPSSGDIFSPSTTVTISSTPGPNGAAANPSMWPVSAVVDNSPVGGFIFTDNIGSTPETLSISGFDSSIDSLEFYSYAFGRTAPTVQIYYSSVATNSLNPSDYTALNGGLAYTLPTTTVPGFTTGNYVNSTSYLDDSGNPIYYDTLSGLNIPVGTQSILLTFTPQFDSDFGAYFGSAFTEIQAEAAPEPSTWAMLLLGFGSLAGVGYLRRRASLLS